LNRYAKPKGQKTRDPQDAIEPQRHFPLPVMHLLVHKPIRAECSPEELVPQKKINKKSL
jgi:hypothetical protein